MATTSRHANTAYLVGFIDKKTLKLSSVQIFSEPSPTTMMSYYTIRLGMKSPTGDEGYGAAADQLEAAVRTEPGYAWLRPVFKSRVGK